MTRLRAALLIGIASLFLAGLGCKHVPTPGELECLINPSRCASPFPCAPGTHWQWFSAANGGPKCEIDKPSPPPPTPGLCPVGERWVWEVGDANGYCEIIPPPSPSPCPVGSHRVNLECVPDAQPSPSPAVECVPPYGGDETWQLINDGSLGEDGAPHPRNKPLADRFFREIVDAPGGLVDLTRAALAAETGCAVGAPECRLSGPEMIQPFFFSVSERLRREHGLCAGLSRPDDDGIWIAPKDPPAWARGLYVGMHIVAYARQKIAWGQLTKDGRPVCRLLVDAATCAEHPEMCTPPDPPPSPVPSPKPSASPTPRPDDPEEVVDGTIRASAGSIKAGQSVTWTCASTTRAGKPGRAPDLLNVSVPPGSKLTGKHFSQSRTDRSVTVSVRAGAPAGIVRCNCSWYQAREVSTPNLGVVVTP